MSLQEIDYSLGCAVVTGGTSGIGRAIAEELATRGVRRMVVVARGEDRLAETAASIERDVPGTSVRTISVDLGDPDGPAEVQRQVAEWGWDVELLVNDAGFARKETFAEDPGSDTALAAVDLMVRAPVELMLRFLPDMRRRGRGGVLNLGSTAGHQPVPYSAAYAASKAFVISFSQAIREENRSSGVRVACIVPGVTETDLDGDGHGERRGALDKVGIDQPADVAKVAVAALEANDAARVVGLNNKLLQAALHLTPDSLSARLIAGVRGAPGQE